MAKQTLKTAGSHLGRFLHTFIIKKNGLAECKAIPRLPKKKEIVNAVSAQRIDQLK